MRRYDIDWLRVIAIGLLIVYHIAICFQPWGVFIGFIQSNQPIEALWPSMSMLNVWRIPLLFYVSGMGVYFAIHRRDWKGLLTERLKRIVIPLVFGMLAIVPLHVLIWQHYYSQELTYQPDPAHLWFLGNIFIYVLLLSPLFFYLKKHQDGQVQKRFSRVLGHPAGLLLLMTPFALEVELITPEVFELYAMTLHGFWLGLIAFAVGFCCVYAGTPFWEMIAQWKWVILALASTLFAIRWSLYELKSPDVLMSIESNLWILAVFGLGYRYLRRPGRILTYLSQSAYPVYILHMIFIYLGSYLIFSLDIADWLAFVLLVAFTFAGCFFVYEMLIKRMKWLRPLFGIKP